jgi:hypothetical protein
MHCSGISGVRPDSQRTIIRVITLCALDDWVYVDSLEEALFYLLNIRRVKSKDADSSLAAGAFAVEVVCPMAISNIDKQGWFGATLHHDYPSTQHPAFATSAYEDSIGQWPTPEGD